MKENHKVVLSVGSNESFAKEIVATAVARLHGLLNDLQYSGSYVTRPISGEGSDYVNAVVSGCYRGTSEELVKECKRLERKFGRDEEARMKRNVPLDLDVVIIDGRVVREKDYGYSYFQIGLELLRTKSKNSESI